MTKLTRRTKMLMGLESRNIATLKSDGWNELYIHALMIPNTVSTSDVKKGALASSDDKWYIGNASDFEDALADSARSEDSPYVEAIEALREDSGMIFIVLVNADSDYSYWFKSRIFHKIIPSTDMNVEAFNFISAGVSDLAWKDNIMIINNKDFEQVVRTFSKLNYDELSDLNKAIYNIFSDVKDPSKSYWLTIK